MPVYHFGNLSQLTMRPARADQGLRSGVTFHPTRRRRDTVQLELFAKQAMCFLQPLKDMPRTCAWAVPGFLNVSCKPSPHAVCALF